MRPVSFDAEAHADCRRCLERLLTPRNADHGRVRRLTASGGAPCRSILFIWRRAERVRGKANELLASDPRPHAAPRALASLEIRPHASSDRLGRTSFRSFSVLISSLCVHHSVLLREVRTGLPKRYCTGTWLLCRSLGARRSSSSTLHLEVHCKDEPRDSSQFFST